MTCGHGLTWLGTPGGVVQCLDPAAMIMDPAAVRAAMDEVVARRLPAVHASPVHRHAAGCWDMAAGAIVDTLYGPGYVCVVQQRWPTRYDAAGAVVRMDDWAWYPLAVVERTL